MSQQTTGRAALVANNLPTSKTISGATNATPIVVTTTTPHGLQTNEIVAITGVTGNTAANGTFIAVVLSGSTFALTAYPGGSNVAGSGAYVSGGTLQSLGYGVTVPVPNDVTDMMQAGSVNVPHEAELDRLAYLMYRAGPNGTLESTKVDRAGDTMTGDLHFAQTKGIVMDGSGGIINGTVSAGGTWTVAGSWAWTGGTSSLVANDQLTTGSDSLALFQGRKRLWRARANIADGNKTIGVHSGTGVDYDGDRFNLPGTTAAKRTITLKSTGTGTTPGVGEMLTLFCQPVGLTISGGVAFEFQREDASVAARVYWDTLNVPTQTGADNFWLTFEYTGGAWTLAENSGSTSDATNAFYVGVRLL